MNLTLLLLSALSAMVFAKEQQKPKSDNNVQPLLVTHTETYTRHIIDYETVYLAARPTVAAPKDDGGI